MPSTGPTRATRVLVSPKDSTQRGSPDMQSSNNSGSLRALHVHRDGRSRVRGATPQRASQGSDGAQRRAPQCARVGVGMQLVRAGDALRGVLER